MKRSQAGQCPRCGSDTAYSITHVGVRRYVLCNLSFVVTYVRGRNGKRGTWQRQQIREGLPA